MDLQNPISALIERRNTTLANEARKAEAEANALRKLADHWPADRKLSGIYHSSAFSELGNLYCSAEVGSRAEALMYLAAFELQPLTYFQGHGFSTIRVKDWVKPGTVDRYETEITDIYPMFWRFSTFVSPLLIGSTQYDELRVNVKVTIKDDPAKRRIRRGDDRRTVLQWVLENAPGGEHIKYAGSDETPGDVQVYFPREAGGAAPTMSELLCSDFRQQNIAWRR